MQVVGIFGFTGEDHIGKISFPAVQVLTFRAVYIVNGDRLRLYVKFILL